VGVFRGLSECVRRRRRMVQEEEWMYVEESEDGKEDGRVRERELRQVIRMKTRMVSSCLRFSLVLQLER
jgi:hypothetical protein